MSTWAGEVGHMSGSEAPRGRLLGCRGRRGPEGPGMSCDAQPPRGASGGQGDPCDAEAWLACSWAGSAISCGAAAALRCGTGMGPMVSVSPLCRDHRATVESSAHVARFMGCTWDQVAHVTSFVWASRHTGGSWWGRSHEWVMKMDRLPDQTQKQTSKEEQQLGKVRGFINLPWAAVCPRSSRCFRWTRRQS